MIGRAFRWGDDWPPASAITRRDRIVLALLGVLMLLALLALALLPGAPPEPGFDTGHPATTQGEARP